MLDAIADAVAGLQQQVFEGLVQPLLFAAGWAHLLEDAHAATLCPSFYRAEVIQNPRPLERLMATLRGTLVRMLQK